MRSGNFTSMRVRLIKKLAEMIDGVDLSAHQAGDLIELAPPDASLLLAEGWAVQAGSHPATHKRQYVSAAPHFTAMPSAQAADRRRASTARPSSRTSSLPRAV
jgi:hypothetical protein